MRSIIVGLSAGVLLLSGCKDVGQEPPPDLSSPVFNATFESIDIEDSEILRVTYSSFKTPQGFYQEDLQGGSPYYESSLSITPLNLRQPPFFELSTNDRQQALAWSESSSVNSAYYRTLASERETDRYFEFRRVYQPNTRDIVLSRVHKLSYLDRSMYDFSHPSPFIGRLNARPIDEPTVQSLIEYFWFINNHAVFRAKAIVSIPTTTQDTVSCVLYHLRFSQGDFGLRDNISLDRMVYAVSRSTGNIVARSQTLRYVQGRMN